MGKIVKLSRNLKPQGPQGPQGPGGEEFLCATEELLHMIYALIRPEGGHYKTPRPFTQGERESRSTSFGIVGEDQKRRVCPLVHRCSCAYGDTDGASPCGD